MRWSHECPRVLIVLVARRAIVAGLLMARKTMVELAHLAPPGPLILVSLAGGAKHGYAIMEEIQALSGVRIGPGTLYASLARLERVGLIESLAAEDRRLPYRLTLTGRAVLRWHLTGVRAFAALGLERLKTRVAE